MRGKGKILIAIVLILFSILTKPAESYAAEARASATILIIIPPREEEVEKKVVEGSIKGERASWEKEVSSAKDNRED